MISGIHALIFTPAAEEVRSFFKDVLGFGSVDDGSGWLIFALPPAELGVHPDDGPVRHELSLMCKDIEGTVQDLKAKGAEFTSPITDQGWGLVTALKLPGGGELQLYEPRHASPLS